jgi:hypothetical protein
MIDGVAVAEISREAALMLLQLGYESPGRLGELPIIERGAPQMVMERPMGEAVLRSYKYEINVTLTVTYDQTEDRVDPI